MQIAGVAVGNNDLFINGKHINLTHPQKQTPIRQETRFFSMLKNYTESIPGMPLFIHNDVDGMKETLLPNTMIKKKAKMNRDKLTEELKRVSEEPRRKKRMENKRVKRWIIGSGIRGENERREPSTWETGGVNEREPRTRGRGWIVGTGTRGVNERKEPGREERRVNERREPGREERRENERREPSTEERNKNEKREPNREERRENEKREPNREARKENERKEPKGEEARGNEKKEPITEKRKESKESEKETKLDKKSGT